MSYLVSSKHDDTSAGDRLRALLRGPEIVMMPGAHNGVAALQAKAAGFKALYLSGAAMSASMGLPDLGILTLEDVLFFTRQIVRASGLPLLVDGDTGFGEVLNVMNTVRRLEEVGAAAVQIEDQVLPKKCGHLNDKKLAPPEDMAAKVAAAARARSSLLIIARTDAVADEGMERAIDRARLYVRAGADAIFPEALTTEAMFAEFAAAMGEVPLLANMTEFGRSPIISANRLQDIGFRIVMWPVSSLRVANHAQQLLYDDLFRNGSNALSIPSMQTRSALYELIGLADYEALDAGIVASRLPS
ncbi:carboxyvinyl-carboxyphosphonate phosphorylmutase [Xaviernesmea oryzae]|uniref:Methylisocitrate lyase n=1 Tax=Xaviernesmea oryzae TaxID=464029 RepID=A0A1X7DDK4_9HYPH|nr:methylisocitrate lyase [Xaviernesmea oryzae]SMF13426.1 carboxyvinyl-carboxyphosphonate phosphorylmutase [Xaviernesmea oryzae]